VVVEDVGLHGGAETEGEVLGWVNSTFGTPGGLELFEVPGVGVGVERFGGVGVEDGFGVGAAADGGLQTEDAEGECAAGSAKDGLVDGASVGAAGEVVGGEEAEGVDGKGPLVKVVGSGDVHYVLEGVVGADDI